MAVRARDVDGVGVHKWIRSTLTMSPPDAAITSINVLSSDGRSGLPDGRSRLHVRPASQPQSHLSDDGASPWGSVVEPRLNGKPRNSDCTCVCSCVMVSARARPGSTPSRQPMVLRAVLVGFQHPHSHWWKNRACHVGFTADGAVSPSDDESLFVQLSVSLTAAARQLPRLLWLLASTAAASLMGVWGRSDPEPLYCGEGVRQPVDDVPVGREIVRAGTLVMASCAAEVDPTDHTGVLSTFTCSVGLDT